jgi:hypothetical protein
MQSGPRLLSAEMSLDPSAGPRQIGSQGMSDFVSAFKPLYAELEQPGVSVSGAIRKATAFEEGQALSIPRIYVSTSITSGGYFRDKSLSGRDVITRNNHSATMLMTALVDSKAPHVAANDVMLPTELGQVPGWMDSDYLLFYFSWLSGLSPSGAEWLEAEMAEPVYAPILDITNDRKRTNEERWPSYRAFVEIALAKVALAEAREGGKRADGSEILLQLVDVEFSLGCRSEQMYADARALDRISLTHAADLPDRLGADLAELERLGAKVGVPRTPVELVPVLLR